MLDVKVVMRNWDYFSCMLGYSEFSYSREAFRYFMYNLYLYQDSLQLQDIAILPHIYLVMYNSSIEFRLDPTLLKYISDH